jgi:hypothetical protein
MSEPLTISIGSDDTERRLARALYHAQLREGGRVINELLPKNVQDKRKRLGRNASTISGITYGWDSTARRVVGLVTGYWIVLGVLSGLAYAGMSFTDFLGDTGDSSCLLTECAIVAVGVFGRRRVFTPGDRRALDAARALWPSPGAGGTLRMPTAVNKKELRRQWSERTADAPELTSEPGANWSTVVWPEARIAARVSLLSDDIRGCASWEGSLLDLHGIRLDLNAIESGTYLTAYMMWVMESGNEYEGSHEYREFRKNQFRYLATVLSVLERYRDELTYLDVVNRGVESLVRESVSQNNWFDLSTAVDMSKEATDQSVSGIRELVMKSHSPVSSR